MNFKKHLLLKLYSFITMTLIISLFSCSSTQPFVQKNVQAPTRGPIIELIGEVEYRPNRMVIYPGNLLHSGLIQPDRDINDDPASGRLTANLFLYFGERPRDT